MGAQDAAACCRCSLWRLMPGQTKKTAQEVNYLLAGSGFPELLSPNCRCRLRSVLSLEALCRHGSSMDGTPVKSSAR